MFSEFKFIDKTLAYALKTNQINSVDYIKLMKKITEMTPMIFDVDLYSLTNKINSKNMDINNMRICIHPSEEQVTAAYKMGGTRLKISVAGLENRQIASRLPKVLDIACKYNIKVTLGCIDISEKLISIQNKNLLKILQEYPVEGIIVHDYKSSLDPIDTYRKLTDIKKIIAANIEYGGKNGLGLATGNTLGAVKSGIYTITTSIGGIGGFPAYEEVVMGINRLLKIPVEVPDNIAVCCKEVLECIGVKIPNTKPIIGSNIFAHESGIHVDGIYKKSELYEPFSPEEVGLSRKIVIGKHSGRAAIEQKVRELNLNVKSACIVSILARVRSLAIKQKTAVDDVQLEQLVKEVAVCDG